MSRIAAVIIALACLWGGAYLWHFYIPEGWVHEWYGLPLMITAASAYVGLVVWFAAVMVTNRLDASIAKAVKAEMALK